MRTLALAVELKERDIPVVFICRESCGNLNDFIESRFHFPVFRLREKNNTISAMCDAKSTPTKEIREETNSETDRIQSIESLRLIKNIYGDIEWLVVDNYSLEKRWESSVRELAKRIMVIDDMANREHDADILLDQNLFQDLEQRYAGLVSNTCKQLLGPRFSLLRPEFREERKSLRKRGGQIGRILVFFGGSDPTNETMKALFALSRFQETEIKVDVVVGSANQNRNHILTYCQKNRNIEFHFNIDYMARLMSRADLFIGSGGSSTWERCCLGLPSIIIAIAENQEAISKNMDSERMGFYLGTSDDVSEEIIAEKTDFLIRNPAVTKEISRKCFDMVDGKGASRVALEMANIGRLI
jgi:UDP-2,4-diacetamido-2,4,6-trideoxy-beta-L-altropyranose hydrolase